MQRWKHQLFTCIANDSPLSDFNYGHLLLFRGIVQLLMRKGWKVGGDAREE